MAQKQITLPKTEISIGEGHPIRRLQWASAGLGLIGIIAAVVLGMGEPKQFFHSYLVAYLFVVTIAVGALGFVLIQFVTRAGWSVAVRRLAEHVMGVLPFLALLFIPLTAGLDQLYPWMDTAHVEHDPILQAKEPYLNGVFFYIRTIVYLAAWSGLAFWFRRLSVAQDQVGGTAITRKLQTVSAPGIVVFAITLTFAAFDWIMSLDPHWYSTVFGVYVFAGSFMSNLAFLLLLILILQRFGLLTNVINSEHIHDLGKLMFGFVVFWAYIAFSQFMLIWYANIPEETIWYAHRWHHGWQYASVLLAVGHFCIPFFLLLSRGAKRNRGVLVAATMWLLFMHYLDLYWLVMPGFQKEGLHPHLLDLLAFVGLAGLTFAFILQLMVKPSLVPTQDPRLAESLSFENM